MGFTYHSDVVTGHLRRLRGVDVTFGLGRVSVAELPP